MKLPLILAGLEPHIAEDFLACARKRKFRRGEVVFHEGDPGDSVQVVVRGHFALRATTTTGEVCLLRIYSPGEQFGRVAIQPIDAIRALTAVSLDEGQTLEFFRAQIDDLRSRHPSVNDALIILLARELHLSTLRLLETLYVDADTRVRRRILELGELYRHGEEIAVIALTQADIAAYTGASRATVNRVLGEEEQLGAVERRRGRIVLIDPAGVASRTH